MKAMKIVTRDAGMCVWLCEEAVCGQTERSFCQAAWEEPGDGRGVRGAGQRLCCSVNTSHGEGAHEVKQQIGSSDFLCCGDRIRLRSDSLCSSQLFGLQSCLWLHVFKIQSLEGNVLVVQWYRCDLLYAESEGKCRKSTVGSFSTGIVSTPELVKLSFSPYYYFFSGTHSNRVIDWIAVMYTWCI